MQREDGIFHHSCVLSNRKQQEQVLGLANPEARVGGNHRDGLPVSAAKSQPKKEPLPMMGNHPVKC